MKGLADRFKPGLYRHRKTGGLYTAIGLVTHHEKRLPMVKYVSHTYGGENVRPLVGWIGDPDGWLDEVQVDGKWGPRFEFVGDLPSDVCISTRAAQPVTPASASPKSKTSKRANRCKHDRPLVKVTDPLSGVDCRQCRREKRKQTERLLSKQ